VLFTWPSYCECFLTSNTKLYWWFYLAEGTPHIKAYDEESVASLSTTHDETQDSFQMNNGTPNSSYLLQGGYMLAASYWPKASLSYLFENEAYRGRWAVTLVFC